MEAPIVAALIAVGGVGLGWLASPYIKERFVDRRVREQERAIENESTQKEKVREILSVCYRRALYTPMQMEQNTADMLDSLRSCRSSLQSKVATLDSLDQQKIVQKIIDELSGIEAYRETAFKNRSQEWPEDLEEETLEVEMNSETFDKIDRAKNRILELLQDLSRAADVSYTLPSSLVDAKYDNWIRSREGADGPPSL